MDPYRIDELEEDELVESQQKKPGRALFALKWTLVVLLLGSGSFIAAYVAYIIGHQFEIDSFELQYNEVVSVLEDHITSSLALKPYAGKSLAGLFYNRAWDTGDSSAYPSADFPSFEAFNETVLSLLPLAVARSMSWNPFVTTEDQKYGIELWSNNTLAYLTMSTQEYQDKLYTFATRGMTKRNGTLAVPVDPLTSRDGAVPYYIPVFYIAPLEFPDNHKEDNYAAILFDLNSEAARREAFSSVLATRDCSTTAMINLVQDTNQNKTRAAGITFCPIYDPSGSDTDDPTGFTSTVFNWDTFFKNVVPEFITGLKVVLTGYNFTKGVKTVDQRTFTIVGPLVTSENRGVQFDQDMAKYRRTFNLTQGFNFQIDVYPAKTLFDRYLTNDPRDRCIIVMAFVICAVLIFLVYDYIARSQRKMLTGMIKVASKLVDDVFPKSVKAKLMKAGNKQHESSSISSIMAARVPSNQDEPVTMRIGRELKKVALQSLPFSRKTKGTSTPTPVASSISTNELGVLAELYPETTVLFSDVVGFTAWSQSVQPVTVFQLLETMFGEFDSLAMQYGVYKVETIGDAYLACCGCPEADPFHAVKMADFALAMRDAMDSIRKRSGVHGLQIRIGMHSGPVVAGVIRASKKRFQLFGDTVNTASRMESTSQPDCIQVSPSAATILKAFGEHELEPRGLVEAKGKGAMETYFLSRRLVEPSPGLYAPLGSRPEEESELNIRRTKSTAVSLLGRLRMGIGKTGSSNSDSLRGSGGSGQNLTQQRLVAPPSEPLPPIIPRQGGLRGEEDFKNDSAYV